MARGSLTKRLNTELQDELGPLARGINRFIDKLQVPAGDVLKTASEVHRHAGDTDRIAGRPTPTCSTIRRRWSRC